MIADGASEEEDLVGFNIHNKDSSWSGFSVLQLDPSNPECVLSQGGRKSGLKQVKGFKCREP
jgi:hypothetical protein